MLLKFLGAFKGAQREDPHRGASPLPGAGCSRCTNHTGTGLWRGPCIPMPLFFFQRGLLHSVLVSKWAKRRNEKEEAGGLCKIQRERGEQRRRNTCPKARSEAAGRAEDTGMF